MRRPHPSQLWFIALLLAVAAPALADDEYLLDGRDQKRGTYQGRLEVKPGPDGVGVHREATFAAGVEAQDGTGKRQGAELRVEFPASGGLTGGLNGTTPAQPLRLKARFASQDAEVKGELRLGNSPFARETGQRIENPYGTGAPDPTKRPTPETGHTYKQFKGVPFIKGEGDAHAVDINDVKQGGLGDCYFMAGLAATARAHPERIQNMVKDHGDGTYSVYMWRHNDQWEDSVDEYARTAVRVRLDDQFPSGGFGPAYAEEGDKETVGNEVRHELWPMLFEKAYAQFKGSYPGIEAGYASTSMSFFGGEVVEDLDPAELSVESLRAKLVKADKEGRAMALGVPTSVSSLGIHGNHYYAFWGFDAEGRVLLYNPWGSSHPPRGLTLEEVKAHTDSVHVGPK